MLIFNPATKQQLNSLIADLPQGILLTGAAGAGLLTAARHIAGDHLAAVIEPTDKDGVVNHIKGTLSVKRIRELYHQSRSKSLHKQVFIVDDADKMSAGAQNAFLKLLEEPNEKVSFILTAHNTTALLPTILSRVSQTSVLPITREQSQELLFSYKLPTNKQAQALFVAAGKPAELSRMASDTAYFDAKASIMGAAKTFLTGTKAERLQIAFSYAADREKSLQLLQSSISIVSFTLKNTPSQVAIEQSGRLASAYDAIVLNGNAKLHLVATVL